MTLVFMAYSSTLYLRLLTRREITVGPILRLCRILGMVQTAELAIRAARCYVFQAVGSRLCLPKLPIVRDDSHDVERIIMLPLRYFRPALAASFLSLIGLPVVALAADKPAAESGIDRAGFDTSVKPGDNFFQYVNGNWIKENPIPAEYSRWGAFPKL